MRHQKKRPETDTFDGVCILAPPASAFRHAKRRVRTRSFKPTHETQAAIDGQRRRKGRKAT